MFGCNISVKRDFFLGSNQPDAWSWVNFIWKERTNNIANVMH